MTLASTCIGQVNIAAIGGFYAQMTGVLAGFAFTAMVFLMTPTPTNEQGLRNASRKNGIPLLLFAAFIALIIATLTYSVQGGENVDLAKGRIATAELINGVPFGLAAIMLFQGVALLMHSSEIDRAAVWVGRIVTTVVAPSLTYYYLVSGSQDTEAARLGNSASACSSAHPPGLGLLLSIALPVVLTISLIPGLQPKALRRRAYRLHNAAPIMVLVTSIAATIISANVTTRSPDFLLSPMALDVYLVTIFTLLTVLGVMLALSFPDTERPAVTHTAGRTMPNQTPATTTTSPTPANVQPPAREPTPRPATPAVAGLARSALRQRHDTYLADHYLSTHQIVVSLALGIAGIAAAGLIAPSPRFGHDHAVLWILWSTGLLATAVAYSGTMVGAIVLPPRMPAISDLLLPLLLGICELVLFAILAYQATGLSSVRSVLTGWWMALGAYGLAASASVWRAIHIITHTSYEPELEPSIETYLSGIKLDRIAAFAIGALSLTVGTLHAVYGVMPTAFNYISALVTMTWLCVGLYSHRSAAARLRTAFAFTLDERET